MKLYSYFLKLLLPHFDIIALKSSITCEIDLSQFSVYLHCEQSFLLIIDDIINLEL